MKNNITLILLLFSVLAYQSCQDDNMIVVNIPEFDYPQTETFEENLSAYNIFEGTPSDLTPMADFHLLELKSVLFTDFAHKQRLIKVPDGTSLGQIDDDSFDFPDGSILVKTFYYYNDERDQSLGKNMVETRLMIKNSGTWNVATYVWNDDQTDATLELAGDEIPLSWVDANGATISTNYLVPDKNECITCHQANETTIPLGTTPRNLNRDVDRDGVSLNELLHLQSVNVISDFDVSQVATMVDYKDTSQALEDRARAYLHMNCAHCHNPNGWEESMEEDLDFRYSTDLNGTGLSVRRNRNRVTDVISDGEMPYIGTTLLDEDGIDLVIEYIQSL